jgi:hypothetical protein
MDFRHVSKLADCPVTCARLEVAIEINVHAMNQKCRRPPARGDNLLEFREYKRDPSDRGEMLSQGTAEYD